MKKIACVFAILWALCFKVQAEPLVIENFDDIPIGTTWKMWGVYGDVGSSTATVVADPKNSKNHVLRVKVKAWNCFPEFAVPEEFAGVKLTGRFNAVRFRFYRATTETDDYKQMHVYYGADQLYADNSYPFQGDKGTWQDRQYALRNIPEASTATLLHLGIHHDNSDYYIDDITLAGPLDDFAEVTSGVVDICQKNSSSSYAIYDKATYIPEGKKLDVYTSRYTDLMAAFAGPGTLNIYAGGERTFLGNHSSKAYPDWTYFQGDVHVYPWNKVETGAGFYGIVMCHNGKTFSPESAEQCLTDGKVCRMMGDNHVTLHKGAAMAMEDGTRAAQFGELNTEAGSRIYGYYKAKAAAGSYFIVGALNTDATLAGRIAPPESNGTPLETQLLGLIKQGKGTYTITANDNVIPAGIRVLEGSVLLNNDAAAAKKSKMTGATGYAATSTGAVAYVMEKGVLGGTGSAGGSLDIYGTLEPGNATTPGTLTVQDFAKSRQCNVTLHPASQIRLKVRSAAEHDLLYVSHNILYSNIKENFTTSTDMPRVKVVLDKNPDLNVGDEMVLMEYAARTDAAKWQFDITLPSKYTWTLEERAVSTSRKALVLTLTSLDDSGNPDDDDDDPTIDPDDEEDDTTTYANTGDTHPLRYYADLLGVKLGVAVHNDIPLNDTDTRAKMIAREFNMVVPENNLKFESVEPSQNYFTFGGGDAVASFAQRHKMYMRGHTLAWHNQLPQWVSVDGKKNDKSWTRQQLLDILHNHINKVVSHYKGKVQEWDVVNECLDDDQSIVRTSPDGYKLRQLSVWTTVIGEEFIDSAFVWAHRADPNAKLFLNDYDNEFMGTAKAQAFYNLAKRLKTSGIPIDGVGLQCHLDAGKVNGKALSENIARYAELGLECIVTELDMGINSLTETNQQQQARDYRKVLEAAMGNANSQSVLIWGLSDDQSWRGSLPLPWNGSLQPKPAYYALQQALSTAFTDGIEALTPDASTVESLDILSRTYYSLDGRHLSHPTAFCIERLILKDGSVKVRKVRQTSH